MATTFVNERRLFGPERRRTKWLSDHCTYKMTFPIDEFGRLGGCILYIFASLDGNAKEMSRNGNRPYRDESNTVLQIQ